MTQTVTTKASSQNLKLQRVVSVSHNRESGHDSTFALLDP